MQRERHRKTGRQTERETIESVVGKKVDVHAVEKVYAEREMKAKDKLVLFDTAFMIPSICRNLG
jgi:hypothetical protein